VFWIVFLGSCKKKEIVPDLRDGLFLEYQLTQSGRGQDKIPIRFDFKAKDSKTYLFSIRDESADTKIHFPEYNNVEVDASLYTVKSEPLAFVEQAPKKGEPLEFSPFGPIWLPVGKRYIGAEVNHFLKVIKQTSYEERPAWLIESQNLNSNVRLEIKLFYDFTNGFLLGGEIYTKGILGESQTERLQLLHSNLPGWK
jgi:hypothetical protein